MTAQNVITLARKNLGGSMETSARLCLTDAVALADAGNLNAARLRALRSLQYSVGVFHPDYKRASIGEYGVK